MNRFYLIVDNVEWIKRLLPQGVKLVQLRIKDASDPTIPQQISTAKTLCHAHNCQLIINDYWQEAIDAGAEFIHLGQGDLDNADMPAIRRAGLKVGISTHSLSELDRALSFEPDYVALGPVYPTILKKMPWKPQGLAKLTTWKRLIGSKPLVAIGGLTVDRLAGVFNAGADSAAVVTDITLHKTPELRAKQWVEATQRKPT